MNKLSILALGLLVTSCGGGSYVTHDQLTERLEGLVSENERLSSEIENIRECEEWRTTYVREGLNCIHGLTPSTLEELYLTEGVINESVVTTRRNNACTFACSFETQCQVTHREVCTFVSANPETQERQ